MKGIVGRAALTCAVLFGFSMVNTAHEIVSPLISGPMAAQQLNDSNAAYAGTQLASRAFNGSGFGGGIMGLVLIAVIAAIWARPIYRAILGNKE